MPAGSSKVGRLIWSFSQNWTSEIIATAPAAWAFSTFCRVKQPPDSSIATWPAVKPLQSPASHPPETNSSSPLTSPLAEYSAACTHEGDVQPTSPTVTVTGSVSLKNGKSNG